ncbi:MAG TPA: hypothetical protein VNJ54_01045 [Plantibacter sp.]|uniref:hypothetical protein n=1 Tax=unclassified Plantibacter TaxID=2624265 RepID=UPI002B8F6D15|nr:hypothetical protein [Plantibacter sp.]
MSDEERRKRAAEQEARALRAIESIEQGGDLGRETLDLSNEYSDRVGARFRAWIHGVKRRKR